MEKEPIKPIASALDQGTFPTPPAVMNESDKAWSEIRRKRLYPALNYVALYMFILIVYGGALLTDSLLFGLMWWLLGDDARDPLVSQTFTYAKAGLSLLFIASAIIHGVLSTYSQIKLDWKLSQDE
jgi:hypothetical protein